MVLVVVSGSRSGGSVGVSVGEGAGVRGGGGVLVVSFTQNLRPREKSVCLLASVEFGWCVSGKQ